MAEETPRPAQWFVRRGTTVKGPFPASQISKYLVLGRIRTSDEVSSDREQWCTVAEVPGLVPRELREGAGEEELQRLRQREDERSGVERRAAGEPPPDGEDQRQEDGERRRPEPEAMLRHRRQKAELLNRLREGSERERRSRRWILPAILGVTVAVVITGVMMGPSITVEDPNCEAAPAPGVNWNNCTLELLEARESDLSGARIRNARLREADLMGATLEGADLAYTDLTKANLGYTDLSGADLKGATLEAADLTYADLTGADMSYADLKNASLGGAVITGTIFSGAVWHDGRTCARDSVGGCRQAAE